MDYLSGMFSVFVFGMVVALLGTVKLKLTPKIGADDAQFGKLVAILQFSMVIFAIVAGVLLDILGFKTIIILGFVITAIAFFLVGSAKTYGLVALAAILLGIGGQFANNGGNVLIPMLFSDPATGSNFGNTFFGLGAFLLPLVAGRLLERMELQKALTIIAVIILIPLIFPLFATLPTKEASVSGELAMNLLGNWITWLAALTLFCYIGLETSMATWITSYAKDVNATDSQAANSLSIFFIAMMISRLLLGISGLEDLAPIGGYVIALVALISAGVIFWMTTITELSTARIALATAGFFFGPVFPTTIGVTFQHYDSSSWGTLFGVIFAIGLLGATLLPAWIGALAKGKTVKQSLSILVVTAVFLAILGFGLGMVPRDTTATPAAVDGAAEVVPAVPGTTDQAPVQE